MGFPTARNNSASLSHSWVSGLSVRFNRPDQVSAENAFSDDSVMFLNVYKELLNSTWYTYMCVADTKTIFQVHVDR